MNKSSWIGLGYLVLLSMSFLACQPQKKTKSEDPPLVVRVGKVAQADLPEYLRFTGDVEGQRQVQVYALLADRIKKQYVAVNDRVKKGQRLAVIEHTRLSQAEAQVRAQVAGAKSQLAGAKVSLVAAKIGMASTKKEYARFRRLLKKSAIGEQQVDQAKTQYDSAVTRVQAAKTQIQSLRAQIRALQAGLGQARSARKNGTIYAPMDGLVARRFREVGDMASPQMPLFTIVQMDRVKVKVKLTETDLSKIKRGDRANIRVAGHPNRVFVGKVTEIAPTLDLDTRSAPAEIEIPNIIFARPRQACKQDSDCSTGVYTDCAQEPCEGRKCRRAKRFCAEKHPLKPGMIAKVSILAKIHKGALLIPLNALLNNSFGYAAASQQKDLAVMTLNAQNQPVRTKVQIGLEAPGGMVQILRGLRAGQRLITVGHNLYKKGGKIKLIEQPTSPKPKTKNAIQASSM